MLKYLGVNFRSVLKVAAYACLLFVLYILQSMVFPYFKTLGTKPLIIPVAVMCLALFEGPVKAGIFGVFAGIFCDFSFNQPAIQFTVFMTVMGLAAGYLFQTVLATGFPSFCACTAVALVICALVQSFGLVFYSGADILAVLKGIILKTGYSIIFTFPIYLIVKWINRMDKD